jgi:ribosomal protein S18 acetylase RimI-like enzyme
MSPIQIRPYQASDESAIQEITYRTGYKGEDLTGRGYCRDTRLWFMLFIGYYTRYEPEHCFVAVDSENGQAVGFICGTPDTLKQEAQFRQWMVPRIGLRLLGYTSWRYPRCFLNVWRMVRDYARGTEEASKDPIIAQYPAHLHINLLPAYQSQGAGSQLMRRFEEHMRDLNVRGLHLGTTNKNLKAVPFYRKMGFEIAQDSGIVKHADFDDLRYLMFTKTL